MRIVPFQIASNDSHTIHGTVWAPDDDPRAIVQLFHGLGEHRKRYARFAEDVTGQGMLLVAHDHRGHGESATKLGYFADNDGWQRLSDDGLHVNDHVRDRHSGLPLALIGHSMGSYIAQYFAMQYSDRLDALMLSASTWPEVAKLIPGGLLARLESWRLGPRGRSRLLHRLGFGDFNKPFEPARTPLDWLSREATEVDKYIEDLLCGGPYTCRLWIDLIGGLRQIARHDALQRIPIELPILLTGGSEDPVGGTRGLQALASHYRTTGHTNLAVQIYPGGRHEMFNETNRDEFCHDVLDWISNQLPAQARA